LRRIGSFVLDSYALIGYLEDEAFSQRLEDILTEAKKGRIGLYLHMIHLGEVYYITLREQGETSADLAYSRIKAFPVKLVDSISDELLLTAATIKANYTISYADSFAAALAMVNNCSLVTGDPEFKALEAEHLVKIEWLSGQNA